MDLLGSADTRSCPPLLAAALPQWAELVGILDVAQCTDYA